MSKPKAEEDSPTASCVESCGKEDNIKQKCMCPVLKKEVLDGSGKHDSTTRMHIRSHTGVELSKLKDKFAQEPEESLSEYIFHVSCMGGDGAFLDPEEALGEWGEDVFLECGPIMINIKYKLYIFSDIILIIL